MKTEINYSQTYWSNKGKHEDLQEQLTKLIPTEGEVADHKANPALERFRVASNCYYDLYNNGLCNRAGEFRKAFGFSAVKLMERNRGLGYALTQKVIGLTETGMDAIILAAYTEQFPRQQGELSNKTFIDLTPRGCTTPEGNARVQAAQQEWDSVTHQLANLLKELLDCGVTFNSDGKVDRDAIHQIQALIGARDRKQEAFLRAVAGVPEQKS